ncbi:MAG: hypothetical protein R3E68_21205 [Burkholderiaceae bacterium]
MNRLPCVARHPARARRMAGVLFSLGLAWCWPAAAQAPAAATTDKAAPANPSLQQQKEAMARDAKATGSGTVSLGKRAVEGAKGTFKGFGEAFRETRDDFKRRRQEGFLSGPGSRPDDDPVNH